MGTTANDYEPVHTIWFNRGGDNPVDGWLRIVGTQPDDFKLTSPAGRIPQDVCDAVKTAIAQLEEGEWPISYVEAIGTIQSVTHRQIWDAV